jgi:hypothetical protein
MDSLKYYLYGGIYNEHYEELSDGGPKCLAELTNTFRGTIIIYSSIT